MGKPGPQQRTFELFCSVRPEADYPTADTAPPKFGAQVIGVKGLVVPEGDNVGPDSTNEFESLRRIF